MRPATRTFAYWILPLSLSLIATAVFAYGFAQWARGDTGTPVNIMPDEEATASVPEETIAAVILGDSLARGAGDQTGMGIAGRLDEELKRRGVSSRRTYNIAVSGATTADFLAVLDRPNVLEILRTSNVIIVSIGGNDLWGGSDWRSATPPNPDDVMDQVMGRIETAVERIRTASPEARILFVGLYNPFIATPDGRDLNAHVSRWNARLLDHFRDDPDFTLVQTADIFSHRDRLSFDRFHPSGEGYELIARRIADSL
jgi:lysophospholipase L1-like esterase